MVLFEIFVDCLKPVFYTDSPTSVSVNRAMVEESDFAAMSSLSTYIPSQELSFPVQGETFNDYEYTDGGTFAWTGWFCYVECRQYNILNLKGFY